MSTMDVVRRVTELERIGRNIVHNGEIAAVSGNTAKVRVTLINDQTMLSGFLPVLGRNTIEVGEPAMLLMPQGDFNSGVVCCFLKDPELDELATAIETLSASLDSAVDRIGTLESQITQINNRISNLSSN